MSTTLLFQWLADVFNHSITPEHSTIVVHTPWSVVIQAEIGRDCYFLKQTPSDLFIEAKVIQLLNQLSPNAAIADVLFINPELHSFIMKSCGHYSLRTKFNGTLEEDRLQCGIKTYIEIQRAVEHQINAFMAIGVPDWRLQHIPNLYVALLENKDVVVEEGISAHEAKHLLQLVPQIKSICELLSLYPINETLVNCDFNENNMIFNEDTQLISIIDWGEVVITHPFFSLASHIRNLKIRYGDNDQQIDSIKQHCLLSWSDIDKQDLEFIYNAIQKILPIFTALSLFRLQKATHNESKRLQRFFIKDCLCLLLEKGHLELDQTK